MEISKSDSLAIKGIAILLMLWHHLFINAAGFGQFTHSLATCFKVCVALFLFVSGYGLTKQYNKLELHNVRTTIKYLLRRFSIFFLLYWFCFILVTVIGNVFGYTFKEAYPASRNVFKCLALDFLGQMGYDSYLKPWWFNKMIIQLYLLFPILFIIVHNRYTAIVGLIAVAFVQLYAKIIPGNIFFIVEGGLPAFYLGILASRFEVIPDIKKLIPRIALGVAAALIAIALSILLLKVIKYAYQAVMIRALMAFCIIVAYKSFERGSNRILEFVGKYAAIMYMTHVLIVILFPKIVYFSSFSILVYIPFAVACLIVAITIEWLKKVSRFDKLGLAIVNRINRL